jgi:DNA processing protein
MKKYLAAFGAFPAIRGECWHKIIGYFPNIQCAWEANVGELRKAGLSDKFVSSFVTYREQVEPEKILDDLNLNHVGIFSLNDTEYPKLLKEIPTPPFIIYVKGRLKPEDENAIGIVGSRKGTDYGKRVTFEIAKELAEAGITIISGLAIGLDTEAHRGALAGRGRTIAVLANGLNFIYPSSNNSLAEKILENGCIISEQPLGMPALKQNFPARNRIISGLSHGIVVTEAGENSGTLHTASFALEQNRQIYAIPGPIYNPLAVGPNSLLKQGAKPITCSQDILEDFGIEVGAPEITPVGDDEKLIFELLKTENLHIDEMVARSKREPAEISKILTLMEIKGKVRQLGGMVYSLR